MNFTNWCNYHVDARSGAFDVGYLLASFAIGAGISAPGALVFRVSGDT